MNDHILREDTVLHLRSTADTWRLLQKFTFSRGDADDLLALARTIQLTSQIKNLIQERLSATLPGPDGSEGAASSHGSFQRLLDRIDNNEPTRIANKIYDSIDEEQLSEQHRLEDNEAASVVDMAKSVLGEEGETLTGIPKALKSKKSQGEKEKEPTSTDVWIMRPRLADISRIS